MKDNSGSQQVLDAKRIEITSQTTCFFFRDNDVCYHFLLEIARDSDVDLRYELRGLQVLTETFEVKGYGEARFVDFRCNDESFLQPYLGLLRRLLDELETNRFDTDRLIKMEIELWKSFWEKNTSLLIDLKDQIGLYCELLFLKQMMSLNLEAAIEAWKGPEASSKDFEFPLASIEVKGTIKANHVHRINGLDQLDVQPDRQLFLASYKLFLEEEFGSSIFDSCCEIVDEFLHDKPALKIKFYEKLHLSSFDPNFTPEDSLTRFALGGIKFFLIDENFPSITSNSFTSNLSSRISKISYNIDLEGVSFLDFDEFIGVAHF